ncbi:ferric reductase family protein [Aspergillus saccharolyticus JOP 1030-1]|uniref:ferric-chelate reductase (NADPH) n=1 Tax=Aspergillus saccharolyticus JOP 1030-1 TaxID=1450539 RepID=A0A318Z7B9_9EURO|nr:putative ferric-chelate reductase [Aspergillus saccharolyticus JOP 1030-1]PYH43009.1 putative ferric-chelate reductase [Aspergillus saccharolyticus JOP 1030-1]
MSAAWLTSPVQLTGSRDFTCDGFTTEECDYYMQRWHFWYVADYVYALPTIAFFMCSIGIFIIGYFLSSILGYRRKFRGPQICQLIAFIRYLSYRGFHIRALGWNSAPLGVLLLGAAGAVYFCCMVLIPQPYYWSSLEYGSSPPLATRSGWMALACMPFVFATATKTSWITLLTGVSHEKLQVFHRWISYGFFVLALLHTFPFIVFHIRFHDMVMHFETSLLFYWTGIVAIIFQAWLTFASHSVIRRLGYEFFKATHFSAAAVFMLIFFWHCDYTLTSWHYFIATAAVYVPCFLHPWLRTLFEYGTRQKAHLHLESNGFIRITIPAAFRWRPGQHCFLRFTNFGLLHALSAHPFTICSLPAEKPGEESRLIFYIHHQGGFTARLYDYVLAHPDATVSVLVDGPYGGINMPSYSRSDNLLLIAGGSGLGWTLPFIQQFLSSRCTPRDVECGHEVDVVSDDDAKAARHNSPRSLRVILATRDPDSRMWFDQAVRRLREELAVPGTVLNLHIQLHRTRDEADQQPTQSQQAPVEWKEQGPRPASRDGLRDQAMRTMVDCYKGRPRLPGIIREAVQPGESLGVYVCGPLSMQSDVRKAVADENVKLLKGGQSGGVYLHCEHFQWA